MCKNDVKPSKDGKHRSQLAASYKKIVSNTTKEYIKKTSPKVGALSRIFPFMDLTK